MVDKFIKINNEINELHEKQIRFGKSSEEYRNALNKEIELLNEQKEILNKIIKDNNFKNKIEPLLEQVMQLCEENDIAGTIFLDLGNHEKYKMSFGDMILDASEIITQVQLWEARNNKKLN